MKEKITLILVLAVLFAGCGIYSPTPPPKENQEYDYSFLENQNGITEELKLNFSEGKTEFSTKVSLPHWKITEIKFNAESNKEKTFETIIEIYDEKNIPASVPTTRFVNLIKGKQKIDLTELNFSIQKRGEYKIKLNFFEDGKKTNEYSFKTVIGAEELPIEKKVELEVFDFVSEQKEFNYDCSTYISFDHKIKVTNTGNTEVFGKTISEIYLDEKKMKTKENLNFNLMLEDSENQKTEENEITFTQPGNNQCYFGETVKLIVKFIDDEEEVIAEKTLETQIIKEQT